MPLNKICYICGRGFGTHSIGIHIPQCIDKHTRRMATLAPSERRALPSMPPGYRQHVLGLAPEPKQYRSDATTTNNNNHNNTHMNNNDSIPTTRSTKQQQYQQYAETTSTAGYQCRRCGRNFAFDRIDKHEGVCKGTQVLKKGGGVLAQQYRADKYGVVHNHNTNTDRNDYDQYSYQQQHQQPQHQQQQQQQSSRAAPVRSSGRQRHTSSSSRGVASNWRAKHQEFQAAMRSAKQVQTALANGADIRR